MKRIFQTWRFFYTLCNIIRFTIGRYWVGQPIGYCCDCLVGGGGGGYQFVSQCVNFRLCHTAELFVTSSSPIGWWAFHLLAVIQRAKKGPVTIINTHFMNCFLARMTLIKMECEKGKNYDGTMKLGKMTYFEWQTVKLHFVLGHPSRKQNVFLMARTGLWGDFGLSHFQVLKVHLIVQ